MECGGVAKDWGRVMKGLFCFREYLGKCMEDEMACLALGFCSPHSLPSHRVARPYLAPGGGGGELSLPPGVLHLYATQA